jgi:hypothetical protein
MQEHFNSTAVVGDFDINEIFTCLKDKIDSDSNFASHPFIWLNSFKKEDIITSLKQSALSATIENEIYFWPGNKKYFVTDKGFIFSKSIHEANTHKAEYYHHRLKYDFVKNLVDCNKVNFTEYYAVRQIRLLQVSKVDGLIDLSTAHNKGQLDLYIESDNIEMFEKLGFKIYTSETVDKQGHKINESYYIKMAKALFIEWCYTQKQPETVNVKSHSISLERDNKVYTFTSKKECFEKMFAGVCNEKTFKRAIKGKVAGDLISIKGVAYKIVTLVSVDSH